MYLLLLLYLIVFVLNVICLACVDRCNYPGVKVDNDSVCMYIFFSIIPGVNLFGILFFLLIYFKRSKFCSFLSDKLNGIRTNFNN
jgi:hypothetical protein